MRNLPLVLTLASLIFASAFGSLPQINPSGLHWQAKVEPWLLADILDGESEFLLYLSEQADLSGAYALETKTDKGRYVFQQLTEVADRTQGSLVAELERQKAPYRRFWIANMIWVRGDFELLAALAAREDIAHVYANPRVRLGLPPVVPLAGELDTSGEIEWNILKVRAPEVWAAGFTGQGIVIGGQDTGYDWEHPALKEHYRGWDGNGADHNYSWHDAIHDSPGNPCGEDSPEPCDDQGHGTHTMGIMVGVEPDGRNQVGMAPGARWIGCRNMDQGFGTPATYSECYQWFVAPTDLTGENPDPAKAPHVINNSWGCPIYEGCTEPDVLLAVVEAVRAAGILTVHSAGNSGASCGTIDTPAAIYDASFTVGSTNKSDQLADYSSRGPVTIDGSGRLKPDVSAPGSEIRSSYPGGMYFYMNGTSMSGPHVAGLAALLFSARPELIGQVEQVENVIRTSAVPIVTSQACGGIPGNAIPNNSAGWGRIDAWKAYLTQVSGVLWIPFITR